MDSLLAPGIDARDDIELRLGADLAHLSIIRSVTGSIALRADYDLDTVADLRLAVDEACSTLIARAVPNTSISCRFAVTDERFWFDGSVISPYEDPPHTESFGWRVLTTLADRARTWVEPDRIEGYGRLVHIELVKAQSAADG